MTREDKMIVFVLSFLGFGIVVAILSVCAEPNHSRLNSKEDDTFLRQYVAEQRLRENLKDPSSLEIISSEVDKDKNVTIEYRAKNSFGGYSRETYNTR